MRKKIIISLIAVALVAVCVISGLAIYFSQPVSAERTTDLTDSKYVNLIGRSYYKESEKTSYFNLSASGFEIKFYGTKLTADIVGTNVNDKTNRPYVSVLVDKQQDYENAKVIPITSNGNYTLIDNLSFDYHTVRVYKRSESTCSFLGVKSVTVADSKGKICPVDAEDYSMNIEFYGDSITCGYGVDGRLENEPFKTELENALSSYAFLTAGELNAKASLISAGGWPIYKSIFAMGNRVDNIADAISVCDLSWNWSYTSPVWDNAKNPVDVVVINLGTNDGSIAQFIQSGLANGVSEAELQSKITNPPANIVDIYNGYMNGWWQRADRDQWIATARNTDIYKNFISGLKEKYTTFINNLKTFNPNAKIICATGMILMDYDVNQAIDEVASSFGEQNGVYRLKHNSLSVGGIMPSGHPNKAMNEYASYELVTLIKSITVDADKSLPSGSVILKEDFENGLDKVYSDAYEGSTFTQSIVKEGDNNVYKMEITALSNNQYQPFPRLIFGNLVNAVTHRTLQIEANKTYTISFKIKSSVERKYCVNLCEILESAPWTKYFDGSEYGLSAKTSTTTWQEVSFDITTTSVANTNGSLLFTFGDVDGTLTNPVGIVYLDDIKIVKK